MDKKLPLSGASFEPSTKPEKLVFLLHGYGDNAENFISVAKELYDPNLNINFFVPNAPTPVPQYPSGRQWFDLYPNGINFNEAGPHEKTLLKEDCLSSIKLIKFYIEEFCKKFKLSFQDCFIIGFSQGAMMTFETSKYINENLAGCALLSGRILPSIEHKKEQFINSPIILIHGDQDTVLEPKYFYEARYILQNQGYSYESHLLEGEEHIISKKTIHLVKKFIKKNI
tara:strand:- start:3050 stop:3730 length:681 start_codon:yes stop_codon:yes gene_type:complete